MSRSPENKVKQHTTPRLLEVQLASLTGLFPIVKYSSVFFLQILMLFTSANIHALTLEQSEQQRPNSISETDVFLSPAEKEQHALNLELKAKENNNLPLLAQANYLLARIALYQKDWTGFDKRSSTLKELYNELQNFRILLLSDLLQVEHLLSKSDYTSALSISEEIEKRLGLDQVSADSLESPALVATDYRVISSEDTAHAAGILGLLYDHLGQYEKAQNFLLYGIAIYKKTDNLEGVVRLRTSLARVYGKQRDDNIESNITEENLAILQSSPDSILYFSNKLNLAGRLTEQGSLDEGLSHYQDLLTYQYLSYYPEYEGSLYLNLSLVYLRQQQFEKALTASSKAIELMKEYGDDDNMYYTIAIKGNILIKQSLPDKAIPILLDALNFFESNKLDYEANLILNQLHQAYAMQGDHINAYDYLAKTYFKTRKVYNSERAKAIENLEAKYNLLEKENDIKQLRNENLLEQERTRLVKDRYIFLLFFSISISLIIVLLILRRNASREARRLREYNKQIAAREHQLLLLATAFENTSDAVFITDSEFKVQEVNSKFHECTDKSAEVVRGKPYYFCDTKGVDKSLTERLMSLARENDLWQGETYDQRANGDIYPIKLEIRVIKHAEDEIEHYLVFFRDLSLDKRNQETLKHLTTHDSLTSLPNRSLFIELLDNACIQASRYNLGIAVLHINLDGFKKINDSFDHSVGDQVLKYFSTQLLNLTDNNEIISRAGSDEFIMYIHSEHPDIDAQNMLSRITKLLESPFDIDNHSFRLTCCVGVSTYPSDASSASDLIKKSGLALSVAKSQGKNSYRFFEEHMNSHMTTRFKTEQAIISAIDNNEFVFHYQPVVNIEDKSICGAEALIRWPNTENEYLPPSQFIPIAESSGLIERIDKLAIQNIFNQVAQWHSHCSSTLSIAINISARMFINTEEFLSILSRYRDEYRVSAEQIKIEVTETDLLKHMEKAKQTMLRLKQDGYHLALDDFGTGYSSLNYLKQLPIDTLKIDRSFVKDIHLSHKNKNIVRCIIELAHSLDMEVTAEGVELEEQYDILKGYKCDNFQGFLFSPAIEADMLIELIKNNL